MKRRANQLEWDTPKTKRSFAAESIMATPQEPFQDYIVSNYHGITTYKLGLINSIFIKNNKIYNLLQNALPKRTFRCNCVKSFCQAKYCECFRNGQICGEECNCKDCNNKTSKGQILKSQNQLACKCVKSSCLKKYCECYQNGQRCGDKCQCLDCKNFVKEELL